MIENMTIDELLSWANGLGICSFKKQRRFDRYEVVCEKRDVHISLHFGRFNESVYGGARYISFSTLDNREGNYSGMGAPLTTLDEVARYIERYAAKLDLADEQMSIFSLL